MKLDGSWEGWRVTQQRSQTRVRRMPVVADNCERTFFRKLGGKLSGPSAKLYMSLLRSFKCGLLRKYYGKRFGRWTGSSSLKRTVVNSECRSEVVRKKISFDLWVNMVRLPATRLALHLQMSQEEDADLPECKQFALKLQFIIASNVRVLRLLYDVVPECDQN